MAEITTPSLPGEGASVPSVPTPAPTQPPSHYPPQITKPPKDGQPTPTPTQPPAETPAPALTTAPAATQSIVQTAAPDASPTPGPDPKHDCMLWIILSAVLAAGLIAAVIVLILRRRKKKTAAEPAPAAAAAGIRIGKLHDQGARSGQQDCFSVSPDQLIDTNGLLAIVADGMGGLADGDKVSQTAVSTMINAFYMAQGTPDEILNQLLMQANKAVNDFLGPNGLGKSGSTVVAGLIKDGMFYYRSVGDSRICLMRGGMLLQLNREHIYRNELITQAANGQIPIEHAYAHQNGGGLTSYLGMGTLKYIDLPAQGIRVLPGDKFILMSDGVYNALSEQELTTDLILPDPQQAADALGKRIREKNLPGQDNYTAVILAV